LSLICLFLASSVYFAQSRESGRAAAAKADKMPVKLKAKESQSLARLEENGYHRTNTE
jgi:hypothetical protein